MQRSLWIRFATFVVWLVAAASMVYWALRFVRGPASPISAAVAAPAQGTGAIDTQALAKGLGGGMVAIDASSQAAPAAPSAFQASRFVLTGVVVHRNSAGVALLAVDGKPPRPYRVGSPLAEGIVLHGVSPGKAMLAASMSAEPGLTLELPQQSSAVVGTAVVSRPMIAAAPAPAVPVINPAAMPGGTAMSALGQRPARLAANRELEAERAKEKAATAAAPAQ